MACSSGDIMKNLLCSFSILILIAACGKMYSADELAQLTIIQPNNIQTEFMPYYSQFLREAKKRGVYLAYDQGLTIEFADDLSMPGLPITLGVCSNVGHGNSTIKINQQQWEHERQAIKFITIFHELGHCILGKVHVQDKQALMNALVDGAVARYSTDLDKLLDEFFYDEDK